MKKTLALLLTLAVTLSALVPFALPTLAIEDAGEPQPVGTETEFMAMDANSAYYLTADITLSATYPGTFAGTLDGKGKTLTVSAPVFDSLKGSVKDLVINGSVSSADDNVGALARTGAAATVENVTNNASVTGVVSAKKSAAGIVGCLEKGSGLSTFTGCVNKGEIAGHMPGGIVGKAEAPIKLVSCTNLANVLGGDCSGGMASWFVEDFEVINCVNGSEGTAIKVVGQSDGPGGIVGYISAGTGGSFTGCVNYGTMEGKLTASGGIIGRTGSGNADIAITNCTNYGYITNAADGSDRFGCGGIVGEAGANFTFVGCVNYADVDSPNYNAAGIIGKGVQGLCSFTNCVNFGTMTGKEVCGGIAGALGNGDTKDGNYVFTNCLNFGTVTSATDTAGGIIGYLYGNATHGAEITGCYNAGDVTGGSEGAGMLGYMNGTTDISVKNCVNIGKIKMNGTTACAIFLSNNSAAVTGTIEKNYYLAGCSDIESYDAKAGIPAAGTIAEADIASGAVTYLFNSTNGTELLFQTLGTDAAPVADASHGHVVKDGDTYKNSENAPSFDDFIVMSAEEFAAMAPDGIYELGADIAVSETYAETFTGTFDGKGHKITASAPLFAMLDGATIKDLTLDGAVELENIGSGGGAVLAKKSNSATLTNIVNNASLTIKSINGAAYVGTLIGAVAKGTLIVTDCVNNGAVTLDTAIGGSTAPRLGGLTGNVAKDVVPTFTNCVNNGNLTMHDTSEAVTTGACYFGGISSDCFCGTFDHCVNNGNLTANVPLDGAGICGRTPPSKQLDDHSVTYTYCVNNGNITTSAVTSRAIGGIQGYAGAKSVAAVYTIDHCINTGAISYTNPEASGNIGGLAGYVYASGTTEYVKVTNCINTGDVSAAGATYVSEFIGYSNSPANVVSYNLGLGKLSTGKRVFEEADVYTTVIIGCSSADMASAVLTGNAVLDTAGLEWKTWTATAENVGSRVKVADAPAGDILLVTAAQVASGEAAYLINQAAGSDVFFQNIDKGTKDAIPVLDDTHAKVFKNYDGFSNTEKAAPIETGTPTQPQDQPTAEPTQPQDQPTEAPTQAPTQPEDQPTEAPTQAPEQPTEAPKDDKGCGSVVACGLVLVAILGSAYVAKRKF